MTLGSSLLQQGTVRPVATARLFFVPYVLQTTEPRGYDTRNDSTILYAPYVFECNVSKYIIYNDIIR